MTERKPTRRRARKPDGTYQGNNPATETNEAWEPVEIQDSVGEKKVDYSVKQKVDGTSNASAGKYSKKPKVRPTFGNVYSESK